jgi:phosphohistidine phosphatase SixA
MRLLLLRHGVAQDAGPETGWSDEPRALTPDGRARMERAARGMAALGVRADAIVTSPLTRCRQTAEIVAAAIGGAPRDDARLRPGADLDAVADLLLEHPDAGAVLLCGHQPDLSDLVGDLTGGGRAEFRKGTLAVLDLEAARPRGGRLRALYPPSALRALGEG